MAIKDEMYKKIVQEIDASVKAEKFNVSISVQKTKRVAEMLTELSVGPQDADMLVSQYMAKIKQLCNE